MKYSEFRKQIEKGDIPGICLFVGEEEFLRDYATTYLKNKIINDHKFDIHTVQGKNNTDKLADIINTFPIFNKSKLIIVRDSGLFARELGKEAEELIENISRPDNGNCIVFHEDKVDIKSALYKKIREDGLILDCGTQNDVELAQWAVNVFKKENFSLDVKLAEKFIDMSERKMKSIMNDIHKIIAYKGSNKLITREDIELMTTRSITDSIFNLLDAISSRNRNNAIYMLDEMIRLKQKEQYILYMISVNFMDMLNAVKLRKKNKSFREIAMETGIRYDWKVRKLLGYSKRFSEKEIQRIICCCAEADMNIKKGLYKGRLSLEVLISEIVR